VSDPRVNSQAPCAKCEYGRHYGSTLSLSIRIRAFEIGEAMPERQPLPRCDIRQVRIPLGPVAVFGASNFPLAFSVAGGDTASALATGCPVIVKAHSAHMGTSELVGRAIQHAIIDQCLPDGIFSLLYDAGRSAGEALAAHPHVKAIGFTGSRQGGLALVNIANARPVPIPVYAEMASTNPVFILPGALQDRAEAIAQAYSDSVTMGAGQFCTNPGLANGFPTGVEVNHAQVHGGPFPSTSNVAFTSVGASAIERFLRPVAYQDLPDALRPQAIQESNPLGLWRMMNGQMQAP